MDKQLIGAAINGNLRLVKLLHSKGADIHAENDQALIRASLYGHLNVVRYLVEKGANIHVYDDLPLIWASQKGHLEVVKYLVENGANIHAQNDQALIWASGNAHLEVVSYLLDNGADIHARNDYMLILASENGNLEVVKYLIEQGANWKVLSKDMIKNLLKEETNKLSKTLTNSYLSVNKNIPTIDIDGNKSLIPKSLLLKMVYEAPYSELCSKINYEIPPLKLIALANLMKLDYDIDITWLNLCDKIKKALYLMM